MSSDLQVLDLEVLVPNPTLSQGKGMVNSLPMLRMHLEDGSEFIMAGIPLDTATAILRRLHNQSTPDSRHSCHDVICEISQVISTTVDCIVPKSSAFAATTRLKVEGFTNDLKFQMIPSQAVLLALTAEAPIYVSRELIELQKRHGE